MRNPFTTYEKFILIELKKVTKSQNIQSIQTENFLRSSRSQVYYKKSEHKSFTKFRGKVCAELFLDKAAGWRNEFLSKKDSGMGVFWKIFEIPKNSFYKNNSRSLVLTFL